MAQWRRLSTIDQFKLFLRSELLAGRWTGTMPGVHRLSEEYGLNRKTVNAVLRLLEKEGLLLSQGLGRGRLIVLPENHATAKLQVAILLYEQSDRNLDYHIAYKNRLEEEGHNVFYAPSTLTEMKMNVQRLSRMMKKTNADAWIVVAGTDHVLEWFVQQKISVFALFGRWGKLKIAALGPNNIAVILEATRRLVELGHHRIVFLDSLFNASEPGTTGSAFLDELSASGIDVGSFNLPGWEGGLEGLYPCLESLFQFTPPTAILASSRKTYYAILHFLLNRGIRVPQDISIVCIGGVPHFKQYKPLVSHSYWESSRPVVNRILRWINNISQGKEDTRQTSVKVEFIEGGTIGPVPKG